MRALATLCAAGLTVFSCYSSAQIRPAAPLQDYPNRPVRWIITFAAGGPTDFLARTIGAKLTESLGQQVVIDIHAGASGRIGTELVARAAPDGYTLLFGSGTAMTIAPALGGVLPYDPFKDFAPVSMLVINPQLLVVNSTLPVKSVKELIALAKSRPGSLNFGSGGTGSTPHLGMELLKSQVGINMVHIPYKGVAPAMTDLIGGHVMLLFNTMQPSVLALARNGRVRGLAVSSAQRSAGAPEIPTVAESGVPGFENVAWFALFAPARTPQAVIAKLNAQLKMILADPETAQRLVSQGADPAPGTPDTLAEYMRVEYGRLKDVIKSAGIKAE